MKDNRPTKVRQIGWGYDFNNQIPLFNDSRHYQDFNNEDLWVRVTYDFETGRRKPLGAGAKWIKENDLA